MHGPLQVLTVLPGEEPKEPPAHGLQLPLLSSLYVPSAHNPKAVFWPGAGRSVVEGVGEKVGEGEGVGLGLGVKVGELEEEGVSDVVTAECGDVFKSSIARNRWKRIAGWSPLSVPEGVGLSALRRSKKKVFSLTPHHALHAALQQCTPSAVTTILRRRGSESPLRLLARRRSNCNFYIFLNPPLPPPPNLFVFQL